MIEFTQVWFLDIILLIGIIIVVKKPLPIFLIIFGFLAIQATFRPFNTVNSIFEWVYEVVGLFCILSGGYLTWRKQKIKIKKKKKNNKDYFKAILIILLAILIVFVFKEEKMDVNINLNLNLNDKLECSVTEKNETLFYYFQSWSDLESFQTITNITFSRCEERLQEEFSEFPIQDIYLEGSYFTENLKNGSY